MAETVSREIRLKNRPVGLPSESDFELATVPMPTPGTGEVLVRWKVGDGYIIDGFGPDGVSARVLDVTRNVVRLQTGYLYHYAFAMLIGVAGLITWFMFGLGVQ
jgi:hypothetical protein